MSKKISNNNEIIQPTMLSVFFRSFNNVFFIAILLLIGIYYFYLRKHPSKKTWVTLLGALFRENNTFIIVIAVFLFLSFLYSRITYFEKEITVKEINNTFYGKYGSNIIVDTDDNIYSVSNTIYYLHFQAVELYAKIDSGKKYKIRGYGKRIPFLGMMPIIIDAKPVA